MAGDQAKRISEANAMGAAPSRVVRQSAGRLFGAAIFALLLLVGAGSPLLAAPSQPGPQPQASPRVVEIGIYVTNIYDLNFSANTYKISFWLWFKSKDEKYQPEKSIEIVGGKDIKIDATDNETLADGTFYRSAKYSATISQLWDVRFFPFESQQLSLVIESSSEDESKLIFISDTKSSGADPNVIPPAWRFRTINVGVGSSVYHTDFGTGTGGDSTYSKFATTITLDHQGEHIFSTAFLGFFVADLLTGVTLFVGSFETTRLAIPLMSRLNMVVGSLFGAVGNAYIKGNSLPPTPSLSLADVIEIGSFSAIAVALFTVIGTETLTRLAYSPETISAVARTSVALYLASQIGLGAYFLTTTRDKK